eukprot:967670-Pelagomonas_calceolata.AAC.2
MLKSPRLVPQYVLHFCSLHACAQAHELINVYVRKLPFKACLHEELAIMKQASYRKLAISELAKASHKKLATMKLAKAGSHML